MFEALAPLISTIKNAGPPFYGAVFVATAIMVGIPDHAISQLGLEEFRNTYRTYIGFSLLASFSLLFVHLIAGFRGLLLVMWRDWGLNRNARKTLSELTEEEKQFLRPYVVDGGNTRYAHISDGVAKGLELKGIVYRAANLSAPGGAFPFNLQPHVRRILRKSPHLVN